MKTWRYEEGTNTIRSVPGNHWIATMDSWDGAEDHEANAKLIATAPTLLTMAKGALAALSRNKTFPADIKAAKEFLKTAIARAEGGEEGG